MRVFQTLKQLPAATNEHNTQEERREKTEEVTADEHEPSSGCVSAAASRISRRPGSHKHTHTRSMMNDDDEEQRLRSVCVAAASSVSSVWPLHRGALCVLCV